MATQQSPLLNHVPALERIQCERIMASQPMFQHFLPSMPDTSCLRSASCVPHVVHMYTLYMMSAGDSTCMP